jgi:hypothetical protein
MAAAVGATVPFVLVGGFKGSAAAVASVQHHEVSVVSQSPRDDGGGSDGSGSNDSGSDNGSTDNGQAPWFYCLGGSNCGANNGGTDNGADNGTDNGADNGDNGTDNGADNGTDNGADNGTDNGTDNGHYVCLGGICGVGNNDVPPGSTCVNGGKVINGEVYCYKIPKPAG